MTKKEELVRAFVHIRQGWTENSGISVIFRSANMLLDQNDVLGIPVTHFDISDNYFAEITFYPRVLETSPVKSLKVFIPKNEIILIAELKPEIASTLGYKE
jgi:hypothetical protein